jgi:hypothetical protein
MEVRLCVRKLKCFLCVQYNETNTVASHTHMHVPIQEPKHTSNFDQKLTPDPSVHMLSTESLPFKKPPEN